MKKLYKFNCRISGVNTPEIRTRNLKEKKLGLKVRDELRKKILNKIVKIKCAEFDKCGRLLIEVITNDNENIRYLLINNEYAFSYDGGTKKKWSVYLNTISAAHELANNINKDDQEE